MKNSRMWQHSQLDRHHTKIAWQRTPRDKQATREKSNDAVAWASGSPSFVKIWMQKEPRCPCVGLTPTGVMRVDQNYRCRLVVREIKKAMKKSDVPSAAELFSGMPLLERGKAPISLCVSHSQEEAKGKRPFAIYDA